MDLKNVQGLAIKFVALTPTPISSDETKTAFRHLAEALLDAHKRIDRLENEIASLKGKPNPPRM
jgi:hypothetical protein